MAASTKMLTPILLILVTIGSISCHDMISQSLDGSHWQFRQAANSTWYPATVPGTVHTDLMANDIIPDPYYRANWLDVQWIETKDWQYFLTFDINDANLLTKQRQTLIFEGLDTHATVLLNQQTILQADNMFTTWQVDVTDKLKAKGNTLNVVFQSPVNYDNQKAAELYPLLLPADNTRVYSRKAAYHYGWDWGPRLVTSGVWKSVRLEGYDLMKLTDVWVQQIDVDGPHGAELKVVFEADYLLGVPKGVLLLEIIEGSNGVVEFEETKHEILESVETGTVSHTKFAVDLTIKNPKLWWTYNLGTPTVYSLTASFSNGGTDGEEISSISTTFGLRTIEWVNDKTGSFYVKLNGKAVFMKGGNYIPPDMFMPRVTPQVYEDTLQSAVDANYNMLRVWGGGNWEYDDFYSTADAKGILIWHDLMWACGMYPGDDNYLANVKVEVEQNVKRIRNHPSIAIWVGNNENQEGWDDWGWKDQLTPEQQKVVYGWYSALFLELLPKTLAEIDSRFYWQSSPEIGFVHPKSEEEGDTHYWGVWASKMPIETYSTYRGRFMSEYGMQSLPAMNTIKKFSIPSDWNLNSRTMQAHERHASHYVTFEMYMKEYFRPTTSFEGLVYASQILQRFAIKTAVEAHRRLKPYNMGTLTWQLNDVWPVASWSTRDYYGNWKATQYMQKHMYEDVITSAFFNRGVLELHIVSDLYHDLEGFATLEVVDLNGRLLLKEHQRVQAPENTATKVMEIASKDLGHIDITQAVIVSSFQTKEARFDNINYFGRPKELELQNPYVTFSQSERHPDCIDVSVKSFGMGIYFYVDSMFLHFSDNYFDLLPGQEKEICLESQKLDSIYSLIQVTSMFDAITQMGVSTDSTQDFEATLLNFLNSFGV